MSLVVKFGGAAVATPEHFSRVADIVMELKKEHHEIVIVVSAMAEKTDELIQLANRVCPDPPRREYDMLFSVGERISISLLAMALSSRCKVVSFTGSQSGIITCEGHSDARIVDVKPWRVRRALDEGKVVIVAGCQGVSRAGEITTLGRGGSDTSAVAMACALKMDVQFFKDVDGIYSADPKRDEEARHLPELDYEEALKLVRGGAKVLHERSLLLAQKNRILMKVRSFSSDSDIGTKIFDSSLSIPEIPKYESLESEKI